jgi:hypothetical protein
MRPSAQESKLERGRLGMVEPVGLDVVIDNMAA